MTIPPAAGAPTRIQQNFLARHERRLLNWICPRLPAWVTPDQLTTLGFLGAVIAFVLAVVIPGAMGFLIALAAARLRGLAIAMVTIALPLVGGPLAKRFPELTGGAQGEYVNFSKAPEWTGLQNDQWQYYLCVVIAALVFVLVSYLVRGKYGRAFAIVKSNEAVASAMGISPYRTKVLAMTIAAMIGGVAGFLYLIPNSYVSPDVKPVAGGYLVESPCCSRNIDAGGGVIDIALLHHDAMSATWKLFRKDHKRGMWEFHSTHQRLNTVTDELNADPDRVFWQ